MKARIILVAGGGTLAAVVVLASACGAMRLSSPISGRVVDADTGRPVAGAAVRFNRSFVCPRLIHGYDWHHQPTRETTTDADGRFGLSGLSSVAPCVLMRYADNMRILAPGYLPLRAEDTDLDLSSEPSTRAGRFALTPLRYRSELGVLPTPVVAQDEGEPTGPAWEAMVASVRAASVSPLGQPGVFAARPGAAFDRVAVVHFNVRGDGAHREHVVAQDRTTGAFVAWDPRGDIVLDSVRARPGWRLAHGGSESPVVLTNDGLLVASTFKSGLAELGTPAWTSVPAGAGGVRSVVKWFAGILVLEDDGWKLAFHRFEPNYPFDQPRLLRLEGVVALADVLPGLTGPAECLTLVPAPDNMLLIVGPTATGRMVYRMWSRFQPAGWKVDVMGPVSALGASAAACAAGRQRALYVVGQDGRLVKLAIVQRSVRGLADLRWEVDVTASASSSGVALTAVAVGAVGAVRPEALTGSEVVYAVGGDAAIYRFTDTLAPDQRIAVGPEPAR